MKKDNFLPWVLMSAVVSGWSASAQQTIFTGQDPNSPYYADFTTSSLNMTYTYESGTDAAGYNYGEFVVTGNAGGVYTSNPSAPGTGGLGFGNNDPGSGRTSGGNPDAFTGNATGAKTYTLTAWVQDVGGVWQVFDNAGASENSMVAINGYLPGVSPTAGGDPSELLLSANLKTGANTFGYTAGSSPLFSFLFNDVSSADSKILEDFFGNNGAGGIVLTAGATAYIPTGSFNGNLAKSFKNASNAGYADTFVPEPGAYSLAAAAFAGLGCAGAAVSRRKPARPVV
jgi:hypothetical protein